MPVPSEFRFLWLWDPRKKYAQARCTAQAYCLNLLTRPHPVVTGPRPHAEQMSALSEIDLHRRRPSNQKPFECCDVQ